ncbi:MAG: hypothetical protein ACLPWF_21560 [Bryobacteraceae bacterium]
MKGEWLQRTTLRVASLLAPSDQRTDWREEWRSELWYIPPCHATRFCLGAFQDALWLRRNRSEEARKRTGIRLDSPISCLAVLAACAALSIFFMFYVLAPRLEPGPPLRARDLAGMGMGVLFLSCLLLPAALCVWRPPADRRALPWPSRLRRTAFLILKIVLLQPVVLCGFLGQATLGPLGGFASLGCDAAVILALRWVITDQQHRCPVCLRLLSSPVVIGTPSRTFLEWYGTESTCSRGHGLLHTSKIWSSYSGQQWLCLGDSWSALFAKGAERHS